MTTADAHPPTHVLADLAEGVLDDATAGEVRAHVEQCDACQATLDELARVTVALGGLPAELPVPEFVAARISHALAAERASGGGAAGAGSSGPVRTGTGDGTVAWFRRRLPQGLAAAASVAVLGLAGYVVVSGGPGSGSDDSGGDAAMAGGSELATEDDGSAADRDPSPGAVFAPPSDNSTMTPPGSRNGTFEAPADVSEAALTTAVQDVVRQRSSINSWCGEVLADELGLPLVGTDRVGAGILVVLDDTDSYAGWLISACNAYSNEAIMPQVDVPKAE